MSRRALIRTATGQIITFLRPDMPSGWSPESGTHIVPEEELPANWSREGGGPPSQVPEFVSFCSFTAALEMSGIDLASIQSRIEAIQDLNSRIVARNKWLRGTVAYRNDPFIAELAPELGLTPEQVDSVFILAQSIP